MLSVTCLQTSSSLFMKYHSYHFNVDEVIKLNHSQKIITKRDGIITNCDSLVYYKVRWRVITNCDSFFITKCDTVYYKLRQVLQSPMNLLQIATGITKCDDYYKLRQYTEWGNPSSETHGQSVGSGERA